MGRRKKSWMYQRKDASGWWVGWYDFFGNRRAKVFQYQSLAESFCRRKDMGWGSDYYEDDNAIMASLVQKEKQKQRTAWLVRTYGIQNIDHVCMYAAQNGQCAICHEPVNYSDICMDHDHETGRVRGLLCKHCNAGLGMYQDQPERLIAASEYLKKTAQ